MEDDGLNQSENPWPIPKFYFSVDLGNDIGEVSFQEVSGLYKESIEYRHENSNPFKIPEFVKPSNVILKKGVFVKDNYFYDWYSTVKMNTVNRVIITIKLMDEEGNIIRIWKLQNAFPTKITETDLKPDKNEIIVDTIEIAYEELVIVNE